MRRLITLISAGRNRTIVIRRELPRTRDASSGTRPYRLERRRVLLSVSPSSITSAASKLCKGFFSSSLLLRFRFGFYSDGPGKAQQLTSDSGHDLWFVFAVSCEFLIAGTQTPLRFPSNVFDFLIETLLPFQQKAAHPGFCADRPKPLRPEHAAGARCRFW